MAASIKNDCTDRALCSGVAPVNGPRPLIAPQMAKKLTTSKAALDPLGPNRIDAHNNNGNGRYNNAGVMFSTSSLVPKLSRPTISNPAASSVASKYRRGGAVVSKRRPSLFHVTINGTRVNEARTFERSEERRVGKEARPGGSA